MTNEPKMTKHRYPKNDYLRTQEPPASADEAMEWLAMGDSGEFYQDWMGSYQKRAKAYLNNLEALYQQEKAAREAALEQSQLAHVEAMDAESRLIAVQELLGQMLEIIWAACNGGDLQHHSECAKWEHLGTNWSLNAKTECNCWYGRLPAVLDAVDSFLAEGK